MIVCSLSLILFILAAICNAVMDTLQHHFSRSVFSKLNKDFWNPDYSWRTARIVPFTKYKLDAWHLFKSAMLVLQAAAAVIMFFVPGESVPSWWWFPVILAIYGILWILFFNLFYNRLLLR